MNIQRKQNGMLLIEGLIAILIFSIALLALIALQGVTIKEINEAKYRMEASMFADQLIGQMWAADKAQLSTDFSSPDGTRYQNWRNEVINAQTGLPGISAPANHPTVVINGTQATITISWQLPGATAGTPKHTYSVTTQLR